MTKSVIYRTAAIKALNRLPANRRRQIRAKVAQLAADPPSLAGNVRSLEGRAGYRLRIGHHRVIFEWRDDDLVILDIGHRGSIY